jgi:DNA-binding transcriptional LysR family regulator
VTEHNKRSGRDTWFGLQLRHLVALTTVAEEGTFAGAADRLGYAPSAVSHQIAFLERTVGMRLIDRSPGPGTVCLTDVGRILARHAEAILEGARSARADLEALVGGVDGSVRVGVDKAVNELVMPPVLRRAAHDIPGVHVIPAEVVSPELRLSLLTRGLLDVAFVDLPLPPGPLDACEVRRDPHVLLISAEHPLAKLGRPPTLREVAGIQLLAAPRLEGAPSELDAALPSERPGEALSPALLSSLIANGHGAAVAWAAPGDVDEERIAVIDLGHLLPPHVLGLCWHTEQRRSTAVQRFIDAVQVWRDATRRTRMVDSDVDPDPRA